MNCAHVHRCKIPKKLVFIKGKYRILECEVCGLRYTNPNLTLNDHLKDVYNDDYFFGGMDGYPDYFKEKDILIKQGEHYAKIVGEFCKPGTLLDVGAAAGFLMKGFENKGWNVTGIEPNKTMVDYGKTELDLDIIQDSFELYEFDKTYDLLSLIQVIGHFYDLSGALTKLSNIVKPDGYLLVESWDMKSIYAKILGKNWHEYSPPSVLNWFSKRTLKLCLEDEGFVHIKTGTPNKKISLNHAITLFDQKYPHLKLGTRIIEKIIGSKDVTIHYPPLDVFWSVFKKTN